MDPTKHGLSNMDLTKHKDGLKKTWNIKSKEIIDQKKHKLLKT